MKKIAFLAVLFTVLTIACGSKPEERIKEFAVKFGDFINTNQKDSIQKYYPDFLFTDSLSNVAVSNITVEPTAIDERYKIIYSPNIFVLIKIEKNGSIVVDESKGLLAFSPNQIELLEKAGVWNDNLTDFEIADLLDEENEKRKSFTSPDLDLFNLHGPVKEMTISYMGDCGSDGCFNAWSWPGTYQFDSSGVWTNYKQRFKGGVKRNREGQIIELYFDYDDPNADNIYRSEFVEYKWKNHKVIVFETGFRTGTYSTMDGTFTYNDKNVISGEKMDWYRDNWEGHSILKLYDFEFDEFGNWISCKWKDNVTYILEDYAHTPTVPIMSHCLPEWLKNATASLMRPGIRDFIAMEGGAEEPAVSSSREKRKETKSGTISRKIIYY